MYNVPKVTWLLDKRGMTCTQAFGFLRLEISGLQDDEGTRDGWSWYQERGVICDFILSSLSNTGDLPSYPLSLPEITGIKLESRTSNLPATWFPRLFPSFTLELGLQLAIYCGPCTLQSGAWPVFPRVGTEPHTGNSVPLKSPILNSTGQAQYINSPCLWVPRAPEHTCSALRWWK